MTRLQNQIDQLTHLTPKQREFIEKYISEHGQSTNTKKVGSASDYDRRRNKLQEELLKFPETHQIRQDLSEKLSQADELAENGDFSGAYKLLKTVKEKAKQSAKSYDPKEDINQLKTRVDELTEKANQAKTQYTQYTNVASEVEKEVDDTAGKLKKALTEKEKEQWIQQLSSSRDRLEEAWGIAENKCDSFLKDAEQSISQLHSDVMEMSRICESSGEQTKNIAGVRKKLTHLLSSEEFADFRVKGDRFHTSASFLKSIDENRIPLLKRLVEPTKRDEVGIQQGVVHEFKDDIEIFSNGKENPSRKAPESFRPFEFDGIMDTLGASPLDGSSKDSEEYTLLVNSAQQHFTSAISDLDVESDQMFDLVLKSLNDLKTDLLQEYAAKQGWPKTTKELEPNQQSTIEALALGFFNAIREKCPDKFDDQTSDLTIGGTTYGNRTEIGSGAMGLIYRLTDSEGNAIVMKELKNSSDEKTRKELKREMIINHQLLKGDKDSVGRRNILEMKGAVQDQSGTLYMVMESAECDMKDVKGAITGVSASGVLPEMARNILTQFLFKQSIEGLMYLRDQNMIHFDLKEQNIMIGRDGTPKLGDFGSTVISDRESGEYLLGREKTPMTGAYQAPESGTAFQQLYDLPFLRRARDEWRVLLNQSKSAKHEVIDYNRPQGSHQLNGIFGLKGKEKLKTSAKDFQSQGEVYRYVSSWIERIEKEIEKREKDPSYGTNSTDFDTYTMGRVAQAMQFQTLPKFDQSTYSSHVATQSNMKGMTGAFQRVVEGMTSENPEERLSLESVLESSYLKNLEQYDEKAMTDLMTVVVEYGKLIDTKKISSLQFNVGFVGSGSEGRDKDNKFQTGNLRERLNDVEKKLRELTNLEDRKVLLEKEVNQSQDEQNKTTLQEEIKQIEMKIEKQPGREKLQEEHKELAEKIDDALVQLWNLANPDMPPRKTESQQVSESETVEIEETEEEKMRRERAAELKERIKDLSRALLYPSEPQEQQENSEEK